MVRNLATVIYPYMELNLLGADFSLTAGESTVTTRTKKGATTTKTVSRPNYFESIEHTRNVDEATQATIKLSFAANEYDSANVVDPNEFERMISGSKGACTFKYGNSPSDCVGPYSGIIYDYSITFNEGYLSYTLSIVGRSAKYNFDKIRGNKCQIKKGDTATTSKSSDGKDDLEKITFYKLDDGSVTTTKPSGDTKYTEVTPEVDKGTQIFYYRNEDPRNPAALTYNIVTSDHVVNTKDVDEQGYANYYHYYVKDTSTNEYIEVTKDIANQYANSGGAGVLNKFELITQEYLPEYVFDRSSSDTSFKEITDDVPCDGLQPIKYMQNICNNYLIDSGDEENIFYRLDINDAVSSSEKGKISIKRLDSRDSSNSLTYEFKWDGKDSDVLNWSPKYQGNYTIFSKVDEDTGDVSSEAKIKDTLSENNDGTGSITINTSKYSKADANSTFFTSNSELTAVTQSIVDTKEFKSRALYPYQASITVLGLGSSALNGGELTLSKTKVKVLPYVNGKLHHTAGTYVVYGITDNISSSGFTTTLTLVRDSVNESKNNKDITDDNEVAEVVNTFKEEHPNTNLVSDTQMNYLKSQITSAVSDLNDDQKKKAESSLYSYYGIS